MAEVAWREGMYTKCGSCLSLDLWYSEDGYAHCRKCGAETPPVWIRVKLTSKGGQGASENVFAEPELRPQPKRLPFARVVPIGLISSIASGVAVGELQATGNPIYFLAAGVIPFVVSLAIMAGAGREFVGYILTVGAFTALGVLVASVLVFGDSFLFVNCGVAGLVYVGFIGGIARLHRRGWQRDFKM